jgi:DNA-directed RNA polymerase specialized sigma24 family protein
MRRHVVDRPGPSPGESNQPGDGDPSSDPSSSGSGSVTRWIGDLKAGGEGALQPLWDRYYSTLIERARARLRAMRSPTAVHDEEDLALSAFQALYQGARAGRFPRLNDRDDLWRLLVHLTACKAVDHHRAAHRQKRGGHPVLKESDLIAADGPASAPDGASPLERVIGHEPSPEFAAMVAEEYVRRLDALGNQSLQQIAERKLLCYRNEEIAQQLGCSLRTVTLKLRLIRKLWDRPEETS